jgi:hypothetical protein
MLWGSYNTLSITLTGSPIFSIISVAAVKSLFRDISAPCLAAISKTMLVRFFCLTIIDLHHKKAINNGELQKISHYMLGFK